MPIAKIHVAAPRGGIMVIDLMLLPTQIGFEPGSLPGGVWAGPDVLRYDNIAVTGLITHKGTARLKVEPPICLGKYFENDLLRKPNYGVQLHFSEGNKSNSLQEGRVRRDPSCKESV